MPAGATPQLPQRPQAEAAARRDRRQLLRYILGDEAPADDAVLERVDVDALLRDRAEARRAAAAQCSPIPGGGNPFAESDEDDDEEPEEPSSNDNAPTLVGAVLPPLSLALSRLGEVSEEGSLVAFQLYLCSSVGKAADASGEEARVLFARAQLGISPSLAGHLRALLSALRPSREDALSLRTPLMLLLSTSPSLAPRELRRFRHAQSSLLLSAVAESDALVLRSRVSACDLAAVATLSQLLERDGYALPLTPTGVAAYQACVSCAWDYVDDASGTPVDEAPPFLLSLQCLWPTLGVTARADLSHRVYSALARWTTSSAAAALQIARHDSAALANIFKDQSLRPSESELLHIHATLRPVVARASLLLSDRSFFEFGADRSFSHLLDVLIFSDAALSGPGKVNVCALIQAAMRCAFARITAAAPSHEDLAQQAGALLRTELRQFAPVLEPHEPNAALVATAEVQRLLADSIATWTASKPGAGDALRGLRAAEEVFADCVGVAESPNCALLAAPFALSWTNARLAQMDKWFTRNLAEEKWQPASKATTIAAFTTVELARSIDSVVDDWGELRVQQSESATTLCRGVARLLASLSAELQKLLGEHTRLVPPPPPLVRFKQAAYDLLRAEHALKKPAPPPAIRETHTVEQLVLMLCSVNLLLRELPPIVAQVERLWSGLSQRRFALRLGDVDLPATQLFKPGSDALCHARVTIMAHISFHIVFRHLHFLDCAYVFGLSDKTRLPATLLDPLNQWMTGVCSRLVDDEEREAFVSQMMEAVSVGITQVLLDGGPSRFFSRDSDAASVREDIDSVVEFFSAGVSQHDVEQAFASLYSIASFMAMDTQALFDNYAALSGARAGSAATASDEESVLLRVLSHRAERAASKLLKERLHLPKPVSGLRVLMGPRASK